MRIQLYFDNREEIERTQVGVYDIAKELHLNPVIPEVGNIITIGRYIEIAYVKYNMLNIVIAEELVESASILYRKFSKIVKILFYNTGYTWRKIHMQLNNPSIGYIE